MLATCRLVIAVGLALVLAVVLLFWLQSLLVLSLPFVLLHLLMRAEDLVALLPQHADESPGQAVG